MVHHAIYFKQNYSYAGIIEALSGAPFDVKFISFEDILEDKDILKDIDVIINVGDADTAQTGGEWWCNPVISSAIKEFVYNGGGIIGVGEPSGHQGKRTFPSSWQMCSALRKRETSHSAMINTTGKTTATSLRLTLRRELISWRIKGNISYALENAQVLVSEDKRSEAGGE